MNKCRVAPLLLLLVALCILPASTVHAAPPAQTNPPPVGPPPDDDSVEPAVVYPPDQAEETAVESSGAGDGDQPVSPPSTAMQIFQTIKNIVTLSRSSLVEAYEGVVEAAFTKRFGEMKSSYSDAIRNGIGWIEAYGQGGLSAMLASVGVTNEVEELWGVTMGIATVFFPLVLVANIASVYVSGVSAPIARAEMLQQGSSALLRFVAAGASFWLVNQLIIIGWATAEAIGNEVGNIAQAGAGELAALIIGMIFGMFTPGFGIVMFYVSLFLLFFMLLLIGALILGHLAFMTLVVVWVVTAPLAIVIGGLPYFGWVQGIWLRMGTGVMLLPVVNVILYRFALVMLPNFSGGANLMQTIVAIGFLSLLTTVNYTIGKFVFGPVLEAIKHTNQSMQKLKGQIRGLVSLAVAAAGGSAAVGGLLGTNPDGDKPSNSPSGTEAQVPRSGADSSDKQTPAPRREASTANQMAAKARDGEISPAQIKQARADLRKQGALAQMIAGNSPWFSSATEYSLARSEHALATAEANIPSPNSAAAASSNSPVTKGNPPPLARDVSQKVLGVAPADVDSLKRDLVARRSEIFGSSLHANGHLEAVAAAGIDPVDYVAQATTMSLSESTRTDLNGENASIATYKEAATRFSNMGSALHGHGAASEVHERLLAGLERDVRGKDRGGSVDAGMIQRWLEN